MMRWHKHSCTSSAPLKLEEIWPLRRDSVPHKSTSSQAVRSYFDLYDRLITSERAGSRFQVRPRDDLR